MSTEHSQTCIVHSSRYGELNIVPTQLYQFPKGLPGLPEINQYAILALEDTPFFIMHALDEDVSFITVPANKAQEQYDFTIDQSVIDLLGIQKPEDLIILLIVNFHENVPCVNLKAPVLLSPQNVACQYIITDKDYPIRQPLIKKENADVSS